MGLKISLPLAKSLPKSNETPSTGRVGLTPTITGPVMNFDFRITSCKGTLNVPKCTTLNSTDLPVAVFSDNGNTPSSNNVCEAPVSLSICTGTGLESSFEATDPLDK